ncbi:MAG: hypothetical protein AABX51_03990 [Nanoarchaeota archaeon]
MEKNYSFAALIALHRTRRAIKLLSLNYLLEPEFSLVLKCAHLSEITEISEHARKPSWFATRRAGLIDSGVFLSQSDFKALEGQPWPARPGVLKIIYFQSLGQED